MPQRRRAENRIATEVEQSWRASCALTRDPFALEPSKHPRDRLPQHRHVLCEQNESEREHPQPEHWQEAENASTRRVGINTGLFGSRRRRGNPSVKMPCADDQFVGVFAEAVRAWLARVCAFARSPG